MAQIEKLKKLAEGVSDHLKLDGWYSSDGKPTFGQYHVYADDGKGTGRQLICTVPADKSYFGKLHEYIAAANPDVIIELINKIEKCEELLKHSTDIIDSLPEDENTMWIMKETGGYFNEKT